MSLDKQKQSLPSIAEAVAATYSTCRRTNHLGLRPMPSREAIVDTLADLMDLLFPGFYRRQNLHPGNVIYHVGDLVDGLHDKLSKQISRALRSREEHNSETPAEQESAAGELS